MIPRSVRRRRRRFAVSFTDQVLLAADMNTRPPYSTGLALTPQYYLAELATPSEIEVLVSQLDFEAALSELVPSVSTAEMLHYKVIQGRFSGETMNSDEKMAQKQLEMPLPNGVAGGESDEEEFVPQRKDKGKGRAE